MRNAAILITVLVSSLALSTTAVIAKEEIYRWVDENGVVHFGNQANAKANAELVELPKDTAASSQAVPEPVLTEAGETQPSYAQQLRDERAESRRLSVERQQEIFDLCERHRNIVATLEPMPRVLVEQEDGSVVRMDDDVRLEKLAESKAFLAKNCD